MLHVNHTSAARVIESSFTLLGWVYVIAMALSSAVNRQEHAVQTSHSRGATPVYQQRDFCKRVKDGETESRQHMSETQQPNRPFRQSLVVRAVLSPSSQLLRPITSQSPHALHAFLVLSWMAGEPITCVQVCSAHSSELSAARRYRERPRHLQASNTKPRFDGVWVAFKDRVT